MTRFLFLFVLVGCAHAESAPTEPAPVEPVQASAKVLVPAKVKPSHVMAAKLVAARPAPSIVSGELLVVTNDRTALETAVLAKAAGRDDFSVRSVECLSARICRVVVERDGVPADEAWTRELIQSLSESLPDGITSVEANGIVHALEQQEAHQ